MLFAYRWYFEFLKIRKFIFLQKERQIVKIMNETMKAAKTSNRKLFKMNRFPGKNQQLESKKFDINLIFINFLSNWQFRRKKH